MKPAKLFFPLLLISMLSFSQEVTNETPYVNTDFKKYLYVNYENPIYISTGHFASMKVEVSNGTIIKGKEPGKYIVKPERCETTIITVHAPGYKKEFEFECAVMHYPEIDFLGYRYEHDVRSIRGSTGIFAKHTPLDLDIAYRIDSCRVTVIDSTGQRSHINIGPAWDAVTIEMLRSAPKGAELRIDRIFLTAPGGRRYMGQECWKKFWE